MKLPLIKSPWLPPLLYLLIRLTLFPLSPVPGALPLDPLVVFLAAFPSLTSPRKIVCWLPGLLLGDAMAALPLPVMLARAAGLLLISTQAQVGGFHWRMFHWGLQWPLWGALASDWRGDFPMMYLYTAGSVQGLLWWGLCAPRTGGGSLRPWPVLLVPPACAALLSLLLPSPPLWPPPGLGTVSSPALRWAILVLLLAPLFFRGLREARKRGWRLPPIGPWRARQSAAVRD